MNKITRIFTTIAIAAAILSGLFFLMKTAVYTNAQTAPGAVMLRDINPSGNASPQQFVEINDIIFFVATNGIDGMELWRTDGSITGTVQVKDINPGGDSSPTELIEFDNLLYFSANDGVHGIELWRSDGTLTGTIMAADILPAESYGTNSSAPDELTVMDGVLYFGAYTGVTGDELWRYDGIVSPTMVKDINPGGGTINNGNPAHLTVMDNILYFSADSFDGVYGNYNYELWRSDGTESGTWQVSEINPVTTTSSSPYNLFSLNSTLYFAADDGTHGKELWQSDGTADSAILVKDIYSGTANSALESMIAVSDTLYFVADDGLHGKELWQTDGSEAGTQLVMDIVSGTVAGWPQYLVAMNGDLYFSAYTVAEGRELWTHQPLSDTTAMVKDVNPVDSFSPSHLTVIGDLIYYAGYTNPTGFELGQTDGTADGTVLVKDINPGPSDSSPLQLTAINDVLYFWANDGSHGTELWRTYGLAGVTATESEGETAVIEAISTDTYTITLNEQPIADVYINLTPDSQLDLGSGAGVPTQLVFAPMRWNVPQIVTVTAVNNNIFNTPHTASITHTVTSSDLEYNSLVVPNVTVTITDNVLKIYLPMIVKTAE